MSCLWITASCVLWSVAPYTVLDIWEFPVTLILMRWLTATTQFFEKCVPVSALWCTGLIPAFGATRSIYGRGMAFIPIHHSVENCTSNHWGKSYWKHHHSYDNLSVLDTSKLMKWTSFCSLYWGWGCGVGCGGCSEEGVGGGGALRVGGGGCSDCIDTLRPRQNDRHFADGIFKYIKTFALRLKIYSQLCYLK